eukprot:4177743-Pleurochrysis_carterae.AAC.1
MECVGLDPTRSLCPRASTTKASHTGSPNTSALARRPHLSCKYSPPALLRAPFPLCLKVFPLPAPLYTCISVNCNCCTRLYEMDVDYSTFSHTEAKRALRVCTESPIRVCTEPPLRVEKCASRLREFERHRSAHLSLRVTAFDPETGPQLGRRRAQTSAKAEGEEAEAVWQRNADPCAGRDGVGGGEGEGDVGEGGDGGVGDRGARRVQRVVRDGDRRVEEEPVDRREAGGEAAPRGADAQRERERYLYVYIQMERKRAAMNRRQWHRNLGEG